MLQANWSVHVEMGGNRRRVRLTLRARCFSSVGLGPWWLGLTTVSPSWACEDTDKRRRAEKLLQISGVSTSGPHIAARFLPHAKANSLPLGRPWMVSREVSWRTNWADPLTGWGYSCQSSNTRVERVPGNPNPQITSPPYINDGYLLTTAVPQSYPSAALQPPESPGLIVHPSSDGWSCTMVHLRSPVHSMFSRWILISILTFPPFLFLSLDLTDWRLWWPKTPTYFLTPDDRNQWILLSLY
jgi:hypothetical protein